MFDPLVFKKKALFWKSKGTGDTEPNHAITSEAGKGREGG